MEINNFKTKNAKFFCPFTGQDLLGKTLPTSIVGVWVDSPMSPIYEKDITIFEPNLKKEWETYSRKVENKDGCLDPNDVDTFLSKYKSDTFCAVKIIKETTLGSVFPITLWVVINMDHGNPPENNIQPPKNPILCKRS
jgi:hypothetical protein